MYENTRNEYGMFEEINSYKNLYKKMDNYFKDVEEEGYFIYLYLISLR